jgi:hypothetical protein
LLVLLETATPAGAAAAAAAAAGEVGITPPLPWVAQMFTGNKDNRFICMGPASGHQDHYGAPHIVTFLPDARNVVRLWSCARCSNQRSTSRRVTAPVTMCEHVGWAGPLPSMNPQIELTLPSPTTTAAWYGYVRQ